jgi:hypothetical protein
MRFEIFRLRKEGKLVPHHLRWAGAVRGNLYVKEEHDDELNRATKMATIIEPASHKVLINGCMTSCWSRSSRTGGR